MRLLMRQSAALDTGRRCLQQGLGTWGDLGDGDRVQRLLAKQVVGHRVYSLLDIHCRGTTPFGLFLYKVPTRVEQIIKKRPNAKPLHLTHIVLLKKSKNGCVH